MGARTEQVARMSGRTAFRDVRRGLGFSGIVRDPDENVKHALGVASRIAGDLPVLALELYYAHALRHERTLRREWDRLSRQAGERTRVSAAAARLGAALAVRDFAGAPVGSTEANEYAWLARCSRSSAAAERERCTIWLEQLRHDGERAYLEAQGADDRRK